MGKGGFFDGFEQNSPPPCPDHILEKSDNHDAQQQEGLRRPDHQPHSGEIQLQEGEIDEESADKQPYPELPIQRLDQVINPFSDFVSISLPVRRLERSGLTIPSHY